MCEERAGSLNLWVLSEKLNGWKKRFVSSSFIPLYTPVITLRESLSATRSE